MGRRARFQLWDRRRRYAPPRIGYQDWLAGHEPVLAGVHVRVMAPVVLRVMMYWTVDFDWAVIV